MDSITITRDQFKDHVKKIIDELTTNPEASGQTAFLMGITGLMIGHKLEDSIFGVDDEDSITIQKEGI